MLALNGSDTVWWKKFQKVKKSLLGRLLLSLLSVALITDGLLLAFTSRRFFSAVQMYLMFGSECWAMKVNNKWQIAVLISPEVVVIKTISIIL